MLYAYGALMALICFIGFATGNTPQLDQDWVAAAGCGGALVLFLTRAWFGLWESYKEWKERRKAKQGASVG
jgi:hypothetical protein